MAKRAAKKAAKKAEVSLTASKVWARNRDRDDLRVKTFDPKTGDPVLGEVDLNAVTIALGPAVAAAAAADAK